MNIFKHLINLIYPQQCLACGANLYNNESLVCTKCQLGLPKTYDYYTGNQRLQELFLGRVEVHYTGAFLYFTKTGIVQRMIHHLKYNNKPEIGQLLGRLYAQHLQLSTFIDTVDCIIPVPLHPDKQKRRGYNQSECIAQGLSEVLHIPVNTTALIRSKATETQTRKNRLSRWDNVKDVFYLADAGALAHKHVLLVDDVITTGATIESCVRQLQHAEQLTVSIVCAAVPQR